jgi:hypothetical protein
MYKNVAEALVPVAQGQNVAENICTAVRSFCESIVTDGPYKLFSFEDGRVILWPRDDGLLFRVSARDLVVFQGIKTIIEGSLFLELVFNDVVKWLEADDMPFRSIGKSVTPDSR